MSDTQQALFGGGGSRWITNPKQLSASSMLSTKLEVKTATNAFLLSSVAGFYAALALRGATASISVADTYVTIASITGSGNLCNVVSPTHTAAFTPTLRITVDGVVYVITPSTTIDLNRRMLLGSYTVGAGTVVAAAAATTNAEIQQPNSQADPGFDFALTGGIPSISYAATLVTPELLMSLGWPTVRFESSLVIEAKASLLSANAVDKQCGATYKLDL